MSKSTQFSQLNATLDANKTRTDDEWRIQVRDLYMRYFEDDLIRLWGWKYQEVKAALRAGKKLDIEQSGSDSIGVGGILSR